MTAVHAAARATLHEHGYDAISASEAIPELYVDADVLERAARATWAQEAVDVGAQMAAYVLAERRRLLLHQSMTRTHVAERPALSAGRRLPLPGTARTAFTGAARDRLAAANAEAEAVQRHEW